MHLAQETVIIGPSLVGDLDLGLGDGSGVFPEDVQQDEQVAGSTVEDPVELPTVVASQFSQLAPNLRAVRKGEMGAGGREHVQAVDLVVQCDLAPGIETIDEVADRLGSVRCAVVDGLKAGHRPIVSGTDDTSAEFTPQPPVLAGECPFF